MVQNIMKENEEFEFALIVILINKDIYCIILSSVYHKENLIARGF